MLRAFLRIRIPRFSINAEQKNAWRNRNMTIDRVLQTLDMKKRRGETRQQVARRLEKAKQITRSELQEWLFVVNADTYYRSHKWLHVQRRFDDPRKLVDFLRNRGEDTEVSLSYLTQALWTGGKIPEHKLQEFQFIAGAADYYDRNEWMHKAPSFTDPLKAIQYLSRLDRRQKSLTYLIGALWTGGKIPEHRLKKFQFIAGAAEYYGRHEWLHVQRTFTEPLQMIRYLRANKPASENVSLSYLTQALWTGSKIPLGKEQAFMRVAAARDYYDRNEWMHKAPSFTDPLKAIQYLSRLDIKKKSKNKSTAYLVTALLTGGKIPEHRQEEFRRAAGAAEYYDRHEWLHIQRTFTEPLQMIRYLRANKPASENVSLSYLTQALWTRSKIPKKKLQEYLRCATAADYYDKHDWLHVSEMFSDAFEMVRFFLKNKPKSAAVSLSYLTQALWTGSKIPKKKLTRFQYVAGAADYALVKKELIREELRKARRKVTVAPHVSGHRWQLFQHVDRRRFRKRNRPTEAVSEAYLWRIIDSALKLYGHELGYR